MNSPNLWHWFPKLLICLNFFLLCMCVNCALLSVSIQFHLLSSFSLCFYLDLFGFHIQIFSPIVTLPLCISFSLLKFPVFLYNWSPAHILSVFHRLFTFHLHFCTGLSYCHIHKYIHRSPHQTSYLCFHLDWSSHSLVISSCKTVNLCVHVEL